MEEFLERPRLSPFTEKRRQFLDDRLDALTKSGVYAVVVGGAGLAVIFVAQLALGSRELSSSPIEIVLGLLFIAVGVCAISCVLNGLLALWAWSTIAFRSALKIEASPFPRYWRRPYGPRLAIIVLVLVASVPGVYFRFHNPPLFFGMLLLVALISRRIVSRF
jgi:hypothetical protein